MLAGLCDRVRDAQLALQFEEGVILVVGALGLIEGECRENPPWISLVNPLGFFGDAPVLNSLRDTLFVVWLGGACAAQAAHPYRLSPGVLWA